MGSWNHTCMLSRMHITAGQDVVSLFLVDKGADGDLCYNNALWSPIPILLYGQYNDYGAVENFTGKFDDVLHDYIKDNICEIEQGENPYHDIPVKRDLVDNDYLYHVDHKARLFLRNPLRAHAGEPLRRSCRHVVIKRSLFDRIMTDYQRERYVRNDGEGTMVSYGFADLVANLAADWKKLTAKAKTSRMGLQRTLEHTRGDEAPMWLNFVPVRGYNSQCEDIYPAGVIEKMPASRRLSFIHELIRFGWLHAFLADARISWAPQTGAGSQSNDVAPYELLARGMLDEIAAERAEQAEWDAEFGDEE